MAVKRLLILFALLTILISSMTFATPAMANPSSDDAALSCRAQDDAGLLEATGFNRGECVNLEASIATGNVNREIVGTCAIDIFHMHYGTKGQCVAALHEDDRELD